MSSAEPSLTPLECMFDIAFGLMLPIYLAASRGDIVLARTALLELIESYDAVTAAEVDLVGRIHTLSHIAMDSLNRSLQPDLPDSNVLRYRSSATTMLRTAEQCRKALVAMQARRREIEAQATPTRPNTVVADVNATPPLPAPVQAEKAKAASPQPRTETSPLRRHNLGRDLIELPELDMTEGEIEAFKIGTQELLAVGHTQFSDPYAARHAAAATAPVR